MKKIEIEVGESWRRQIDGDTRRHGGVWIGNELIFECDITDMFGRWSGYDDDDRAEHIIEQFALRLKEVLDGKA